MSRPLLCALALALLSACGAADTSPHPVLPNGAHWINATTSSSVIPISPYGQLRAPRLLASASLADLRLVALGSAPPGYTCPTTASNAALPAACWLQIPDTTANFYVAVFQPISCTQHVHEAFAREGTTLIFVASFGSPFSDHCTTGQPGPEYEIFVISRSLLPARGQLKLQYIVQDATDGSSNVVYTSSTNLD